MIWVPPSHTAENWSHCTAHNQGWRFFTTLLKRG
jgi:hypothetical protein